MLSSLEFRSRVERILSLVREKPSLVKVLRYAVEWEEDPKNKDMLGWSSWDVHAPRSDVDKLIFEDLARVSYRSANFIHFQLMDREAVKAALREFEILMEQPPVEEVEEIPADLFDDVVGYDDLKAVFLKALDVGKVHFMLVGPPSSAKTLFLLCLEKLPRARYVLGSRMTKAGLTDYLFTYQPRYLLLDEIDKMSGEHYGVLLSLCETGRVSEMIFGRTRDIALDTTVFACCNQLKRIPPEVVSRFEVLRFKEYSREEFVNIVENVLVRRGTEKDLATYIADRVWHGLDAKDPREAMRIARLAKTREEVDHLIEVIKRYR
jgi:Holliday junction DNA helicase RuvB